MFVYKHMTANPVVVHPRTTVAEASEIMRQHKFRRLPVVDNGRLVGIVTDRDLREVSASPATSLSIFELNYLLSKMQIKDMMKTRVITIAAEATIEEAALLMYEHKIGGLVVTDAAQQVVGVITESDIFRAFVNIMGLPQGKVRLTLVFDDRIGALYDISGVFKELGLNISSVATQRENGHVEMVIRADIPDPQAVQEKLAAQGFVVQHITAIGGEK